jgi:hypothetical protein
MLKALLLLLLALGVNLTWATHTRYTDLSEDELQDMATTMAAIALEVAAGGERRLRKTRKLSISHIVETYNNRVPFDIAAPSLPLEDFEGSNALLMNTLGCDLNPLDLSETVCYDANSIETGLGVFSGSGEVAVLNDIATLPTDSTWVGANPFTESTSLVFANGPTAVGFDLHDFFGSTAPVEILITYDDTTTETGSVPSGDLFFGVITDKPIAQITVGDTTSNSIVVDNVAFGIAAPSGGGGGVEGDPHFKTWRGHHYDYHGECDLVLLHNAEFESGLGLDVHIRTKIRRDMSYISSAALRIGKDILEVESQGVYWLNGALNVDLPDEFSGFVFSHTQPTDKQHVFEVHLGGRERIKVKTYKDFVSVLIEQGKSEHFHHSVGLMGDFTMGHMIARDGETVIADANAFGQEWQVLSTEPSLFQTVRLPQHPNVCTMPTPVQADHLRRRLTESSSVDELAAEKACAHWGEGKDDCVFDVLATGDLEMAVVGAY